MVFFWMQYYDSQVWQQAFWQYHSHTKPVESQIYAVPIEAVLFIPVFTGTSDISAYYEVGIVVGDCSLTWMIQPSQKPFWFPCFLLCEQKNLIWDLEVNESLSFYFLIHHRILDRLGVIFKMILCNPMKHSITCHILI